MKSHRKFGAGKNKADKKSDYKKNIHTLLKEKKVITSSELASFLKISWNTADKYLLELALEGFVERIKKEGVTLWLLKK